RRAGETDHFSAVRDELSALLARADFVPPFELYAEILGARRGREKLLSRLGPDAADPIAEFLSLALSYEKTHIPSLEGFLYWVETGAVEVKRDLEQGTANAVRVMTVHGAKGLQAPIVFMPDTMGVPTQGPRLLWKTGADGEDEAVLWAPRRGLYEETCEAVRADYDLDRDREYRRLLYVAMTRAEDRLYVCGWQTQRTPPDGCWYNLIREGLEGIAETIEDEFLSEAEEVDEGELLRLYAPQTAAVEEAKDRAEELLQDLPDWAWQMAPDEPAPPRPLAPSLPTEDDPPASSPLAEGDDHRFKRGRLIHALLQTVPDLPPEQQEIAARRYLAQPGLGLSDEEQAEIAAETAAILNDSTFAPLFGPDSQAEVPIIGTVPGTDGEAVISGQLDRLVVRDDRVLIVDYKTNRDPPDTENDVPKAYLRQLAAYRAVLSALFPDRQIDCALLWTMTPRLMAIDGELLKRFEP
ncbi:MAG: PD-(D/E)XK nuclease family protein, partial [Proteobacteria bacterium]|nr:PD-(D/E)XK nuclease family protein [Pseudomonadota bacterium]